jgi:hypothetical protein
LKPEDFDYSMLPKDLDMVNSMIKSVFTEDNGLGAQKTSVTFIHIDGISYMDTPTDDHGPIMKATILHSGDRRLHFTNFRDKTDTHCFKMIKMIFKHYYSKDGGISWEPMTTVGKEKVTHYA